MGLFEEQSMEKAFHTNKGITETNSSLNLIFDVVHVCVCVCV